MLPSSYKTIGYNILDMISKVGFSVFTLGTIINNNLGEVVTP
jgi:bacteriorhodopsin